MKRVDKVISQIAKDIPDQSYAYRQRYKIKGAEAIKTGLKIPDTKKIDPEKDYTFNDLAYRTVNHERRLKKAYKREGKVGVYKYLIPFIKEEKQAEVLTYIHSLDF